ncbi:MAG: NAD+ synthase [Acidobacteria bacterium]|mgnify:CR=1 FL=1|nr:MAG: NAD+ synthase [Acidobacteriota bacterium]
MKIALAQINPTVGDFTGNAATFRRFARDARTRGADLVVFPELSVCGYPPRDLVEVPAFLARSRQVLEELAAEFPDIAIIAGFPSRAAVETGKSVMNSAALLRNGRIDFVQSKRLLPTYDVFDEMRNFAPAPSQQLVTVCGECLALTICEDAWNDKAFWSRRLYGSDPVEELVRAGAEIVLNISASPFNVGKRGLRQAMLASIATQHRVPVVLVNQVGGNDSLVFDGSSLALSPQGDVIAQARSFEEDLILVDTATLTGDMHEQVPELEASAYEALVLGTRDYVRKCGFQKVVVGLSGGIDSALTAVIAVDALGAENVIGVSMPSQYSSEGSITDAWELAANLGICFEVVAIREIFESYRRALSGIFKGLPEDVTEENLQARTRGALLMAVANKFSALVLTTGNKSELGVGYCTLYGDMVGGLAVISDVPKTLVYRIAHYVNSRRPVIPEASITKPPSAELRPGQKDSDSLPPYDVLDRILEEYVGNLKSASEIAELTGFDDEVIRFVIRLIDRSEYKRQQAAPGIRISTKAFGVGRRFPIAARHQI